MSSQLWLMQVLLKTMEHSLLFLIVIFQVFVLFSLGRDPGGKRIVPYFMPSAFDHTFGSHQR